MICKLQIHFKMTTPAIDFPNWGFIHVAMDQEIEVRWHIIIHIIINVLFDTLCMEHHILFLIMNTFCLVINSSHL